MERRCAFSVFVASLLSMNATLCCDDDDESWLSVLSDGPLPRPGKGGLWGGFLIAGGLDGGVFWRFIGTPRFRFDICGDEPALSSNTKCSEFLSLLGVLSSCRLSGMGSLKAGFKRPPELYKVINAWEQLNGVKCWEILTLNEKQIKIADHWWLSALHH